jgi:hypothetical protein
MQVIEISTDSIDDLMQLEDEWRVAARGRRTGIADWLCADRSRPGLYFSVNLFPSHDAAMENGALPETDSLATGAMQLWRLRSAAGPRLATARDDTGELLPREKLGRLV